MDKIAIIASTDRGIRTGTVLLKQLPGAILISTRKTEMSHVQWIPTIGDFLKENFNLFHGFIFIGALGICVRSVAPYLKDKAQDPAVVNADDLGCFVQSVVSGHLGGANELTGKVAALLGAQPVITTSSDLQQIWNLDTLPSQFNWKVRCNREMNEIISLFVNNGRTALLLDVKDPGACILEKSKPSFVDIYYSFDSIDLLQYELFIAVTYKEYSIEIPSICYYSKVLNVGMGCSRNIESELLAQSFKNQLNAHGLAIESVKAIGSADIKFDEHAFLELESRFNFLFKTFTVEELSKPQVANPSEVVKEKLGVYSVSEASALLLSGNSHLLVEKQKIVVPSGKMHTFAVAVDKSAERRAGIAIVGAGPGDAGLISLKGKQLLEEADLILYAGSLIPEELTSFAKAGAMVRDSSGMTLEEQLTLMEAHYAKGHLIVRLQSGDPSIYGAIQEQMSIFEEKGMEYFVVPGISSFQAAAAVLKSEFTIPEMVQTIILTRGEGNTPLPEKEKLNEMAKHQATMCIFLSATISRSVQEQLLEHYSEDTPIAIVYRVSWKDEQVYTGKLKDLASTIRKHKLTRTVLIIVGAAIGARKNRSQLYHPEYNHIFRNKKTLVNR